MPLAHFLNSGWIIFSMDSTPRVTIAMFDAIMIKFIGERH